MSTIVINQMSCVGYDKESVVFNAEHSVPRKKNDALRNNANGHSDCDLPWISIIFVIGLTRSVLVFY